MSSSEIESMSNRDLISELESRAESTGRSEAIEDIANALVVYGMRNLNAAMRKDLSIACGRISAALKSYRGDISILLNYPEQFKSAADALDLTPRAEAERSAKIRALAREQAQARIYDPKSAEAAVDAAMKRAALQSKAASLSNRADDLMSAAAAAQLRAGVAHPQAERAEHEAIAAQIELRELDDDAAREAAASAEREAHHAANQRESAAARALDAMSESESHDEREAEQQQS